MIFNSTSSIILDSGYNLSQFHLAYTTYGTLNENADNVLWIFHALTANSDPMEWWPGIVGAGKVFDPAKYFIVCANKPGSNYGSISPLSINPQTGQKYYHNFPVFTIADIVQCFKQLRQYLGIKKIQLGIGGSTGGMQVLEWAVQEPQLFESIIPIATAAVLSPWGIAFNASQRMAIEADSTFYNKDDDGGKKGLEAARTIAMLSYRHYWGYNETQPRNKKFKKLQQNVQFAADNYQRYQGKKLSARFNALCYYRLTQTMDSHNLGFRFNNLEEALKQITARTLVISIDSDVLYPPQEQLFLQQHIPNAKLVTVHSQVGHDGFLIEYEQMVKALVDFLE